MRSSVAGWNDAAELSLSQSQGYETVSPEGNVTASAVSLASAESVVVIAVLSEWRVELGLRGIVAHRGGEGRHHRQSFS
jgi:hypothetical protein